MLQGRPRRLWLIAMGNVPNVELERAVAANLDAVASLFETATFVEMRRDTLTVRR